MTVATTVTRLSPKRIMVGLRESLQLHPNMSMSMRHQEWIQIGNTTCHSAPNTTTLAPSESWLQKIALATRLMPKEL
jgi:hypothetical protein